MFNGKLYFDNQDKRIHLVHCSSSNPGYKWLYFSCPNLEGLETWGGLSKEIIDNLYDFPKETEVFLVKLHGRSIRYIAKIIVSLGFLNQYARKLSF